MKPTTTADRETIVDQAGKKWWRIHSLGPHNAHDFPLWIMWDHFPNCSPKFFRRKEEMENTCPNWRKATHWREATGDSGKYQVAEDKYGRFVPQELIEGEWTHFRSYRTDGKSYDNLADAKKAIDYQILIQSDREDIIHPYP